jgi:hypothetical protein
MKRQARLYATDTLISGACGGIAGGVAEIIWIAAYGAVTGVPVSPVANGIVATLMPAWSATPWSVPLGLFIHLGLAAALGIGLALGLRALASHFEDGLSEFRIAVPALATVWAVNFFLVLPKANPAFVHMLPFAVTLMSKLLFGLSAALVLRTHRLRQARSRSVSVREN